MHKATRFTIAVALIVLTISAFWAYWVRAARDAALFEPTPGGSVLLRAGTAIQGVLTNGLPAAAEAGDPVTAFVSQSVIVDGRRAVPSGAQLNGDLEKLLVLGEWGNAYIRFTVLHTGAQSIPIQAQRVEVVTPVQSDIEIVRDSLRLLMGATFGATVGAATGDGRMVGRSLIEGAVSTSVETKVPITVILTNDLQLSPPY